MRGRLMTLALVALAFGSAACGGNGTGPGVASAGDAGAAAAPTDGPDPLAAMQAWAQCMRDHGVDMPDPETVDGKFTFIFDGPKKGTAEAAAHDQASGACRHLEAAFNQDKPRPMSPEEVEAWREWAQCMRDHGIVDMPDPDPNAPGAPELPGNRDPNAPRSGPSQQDLDAANEACMDQFMAARMAGLDG